MLLLFLFLIPSAVCNDAVQHLTNALKILDAIALVVPGASEAKIGLTIISIAAGIVKEEDTILADEGKKVVELTEKIDRTAKIIQFTEGAVYDLQLAMDNLIKKPADKKYFSEFILQDGRIQNGIGECGSEKAIAMLFRFIYMISAAQKLFANVKMNNNTSPLYSFANFDEYGGSREGFIAIQKGINELLEKLERIDAFHFGLTTGQPMIRHFMERAAEALDKNETNGQILVNEYIQLFSTNSPNYTRDACMKVRQYVQNFIAYRANSMKYWMGKIVRNLAQTKVDTSQSASVAAKQMRDELLKINTNDYFIVVNFPHKKICQCNSELNDRSTVQTFLAPGNETSFLIYRTNVTDERFQMNTVAKWSSVSGLFECSSNSTDHSSLLHDLGMSFALIFRPCSNNLLSNADPFRLGWFDKEVGIEDTGNNVTGPSWWIRGHEFIINYVIVDNSPFYLRNHFIVIGR